MEKMDLEIGDIVQISPEGKYKNTFGGMLLVVTEPKEFGCQGYIMSSQDIDAVKFRGRAFLRPSWEDIEYIGKMVWSLEKN